MASVDLLKKLKSKKIVVCLFDEVYRYPYNLSRIVRASEVDTDDSWIYEDGHDEIVFSVDRDCQLLGKMSRFPVL